MVYTHLTPEERYQIRALRRAGLSQRETARILGRSPATVCRELARNRGHKGYRPGQAQRLAKARARRCRSRPRITALQWAGVASLLRQDWSPEQIAARARREGTLTISPEWIYRYIYADKRLGGGLWRHLRGPQRFRKRYGTGRDRRGKLTGRRGIEERPAEVERRDRIGHWEADTIVGARAQGTVLSLVERASRYTRLAKLPSGKARALRQAAVRRLRPLRQAVATITADNGKEFAEHAQLGRALGAEVFFCDTFAAWQRGTSENTNGLIRQYLPKRRTLTNVTGGQIQRIERRLNHRPRKCLKYLTPHEVLFKTRCELTVALRS